MIGYRFHPDRAFLRRGALRSYFQVSGDWARFTVLDIVAVAAIVIWSLTDNRDSLAEFGFPAVLLAALLCCALAAVLLRAINIIFSVLALWFGVRERPADTEVAIVPGRTVRCRDIAETAYDWDNLTKWRRFSDMYVLIFRDSPVSQTPVFISRSHLGPHEPIFAAALARHTPSQCAQGLKPEAA